MGKEENQVQKQILNYLLNFGFFAWRNNNIAVKGRIFIGLKGATDIICILKNGIFCGIEVKAEKGKQSQEQKEFEYNCCKNNGIYILASSFNEFLIKFKKIQE